MADVLPEIVLSDATNGDETGLWLDVAGNGDFVEVAEINELPDLPGGTQSTYETTHMKSGLFKEHKKNKRVDGTEVDIKGNYSLGVGLQTLEAAEAKTGAVAYRIELHEDEDVYHATGYALFHSLKRSNPMSAVREFTITAKWVSKMTLTKQPAA